jgi:hypothetical protein
MPKLITDFFTVAQAGPTVDGREIKEQWLIDAAETYSVQKYLSKIWPEHMRWRPFGELAEVRLVRNAATGVVTLENRISPGEDLMYYVRREQMTQPSIEIVEDFANSGKAYQYGLGATDNPASMGVGKMPILFSAENISLYCTRIALDAQVPPEKVHIFQCPTAWGDLEYKKQGTKIFDLGRLFRSASPSQPSETHEDIDMTKDELKEVLQGFKTELKTELQQEFKTQQPATPPAAAEPPAAGQGNDQPATVTLEQYNTLKQQYDTLEGKFKKFEEFMAQDVTPERKELGGSNADDVWDWK